MSGNDVCLKCSGTEDLLRRCENHCLLYQETLDLKTEQVAKLTGRRDRWRARYEAKAAELTKALVPFPGTYYRASILDESEREFVESVRQQASFEECQRLQNLLDIIDRLAPKPVEVPGE